MGEGGTEREEGREGGGREGGGREGEKMEGRECEGRRGGTKSVQQSLHNTHSENQHDFKLR